MLLMFSKGSVFPFLNSVIFQDRCCAGSQRKAFFKLSPTRFSIQVLFVAWKNANISAMVSQIRLLMRNTKTAYACYTCPLGNGLKQTYSRAAVRL